MKGQCFADSNEAYAYFFQDISGFSLDPASGNAVSLLAFQNVSGVWKIQKITYSSSGNYTLNFSVNADLPALASCNYVNDPVSNFQDGTVLGWGVAFACVLAWAVSVLRKSL